MTERREDIADESKSRQRFESALRKLRPSLSLDRHENGEYKNSAVWAMAFIWPECERDTRERCGEDSREIVRREMMRTLSDKLSMEEIATVAYAVADAIRKGGE